MIEIIEEFKIRLEKALNIRGLRPIDLVHATGISESAISQYRKGLTKPKDKRLVMIANALNVNPSWLMGLDVPMTNPDIIHHFTFDEDDFVDNSELPINIVTDNNENPIDTVMDGVSDCSTKLLEIYQSLNQEGKNKLIDYASDLINLTKYKKGE